MFMCFYCLMFSYIFIILFIDNLLKGNFNTITNYYRIAHLSKEHFVF
nr:hypothetical protein BAR15_110044 [Bartonella sp. AR 15-3]